MYSQFPPASVGASGGTFGSAAAASPDALRPVFVATPDEAHRIRGGLEAKRSWDRLPKDEVDERGQPRQVPGSVPRETLAKDAAAMRELAESLAKAYPAGPFEHWVQAWSKREEKLLADGKTYPQARALRIEVLSYQSSAQAMREIGLKLLNEGGRLDPLTSPECSEPPAQQVCLDERAIAYPPPTMRAIAPARTRVVAASPDQLALNKLRGQLCNGDGHPDFPENRRTVRIRGLVHQEDDRRSLGPQWTGQAGIGTEPDRPSDHTERSSSPARGRDL